MSDPSRVRIAGPLAAFADGFAAELSNKVTGPTPLRINFSFLRI